MLQRISLSTADGLELFSGVSLLRSEPPPPPVAEDEEREEDSRIRGPLASTSLLAKSRPGNDNGSTAMSLSGLRPAVVTSPEAPRA
jgi:hypothetical protein